MPFLFVDVVLFLWHDMKSIAGTALQAATVFVLRLREISCFAFLGEI